MSKRRTRGEVKAYREQREEMERAFGNPAKVDGADGGYCEECGEAIIFALKDSRGNEFSLGLETLLDCLEFAEKEHALPSFPEGWFAWSMKARRGLLLE